METKKITPKDTIGRYVIVDYSDKAIAIPAERDMALSDDFEYIEGKYNSRLKFGSGWIFSKKKCAEMIDNIMINHCIDHVHCKLSDMELPKETGGNGNSPEINILTNPEKQKQGLNVNDMAMMLPGGEIIVIGREEIKTEFCFGYSSCGQGPTSEEAHKALDDARSNPEYFMAENLERLDCILDKLNNPGNGECRHLWIANWYTGGKNRWNLEFSDTPTDKPEWLDSREKALYDEGMMRPVTSDERGLLIEFYKLTREAREKRCRTYLKRYGLTKLRCWTYWMDE